MNKKIAILLFCCFIGLPLLLFVAGQRGVIIEKRKPHSIAPASWNTIKSGAWFASINDYLIDHTPLRHHAIRANAFIDWEVFHEGGNSNVSRGLKDWLFYNRGLDHPCVDSTEIQRRLLRLVEITEQQLTHNNTRIIWAIAPNKEAIYPEMLTPIQSRRANCATQNRKAMREILRDPVFTPHMVELWSPLERQKPLVQRVFYQSDSHWNDIGALKGMEALFSHIWPEKLRLSNFAAGKTNYINGDLAKMLGMDMLQEPAQKITRVISPPKGGKIEDETLCIESETPRLRSYKHTATSDALIPEKVVILRDSFFDTPIEFIPPYFAQVDIGHIDHTPVKEWPKIAACADTLVVISVERSFLNRAEQFAEALALD
ncbi:MAG: hypothetical protein MK052_08955 [Alphaproteobacteria bacterium]|nr:hypothetical protein [Alphaproteobacteria bacterium]